MKGYSAKVRSTTWETTAKERIQLKDLTQATDLNEATMEGKHVTIKPAGYAIVDIHNEKSDNKDYSKIVIKADDGTMYMTGSTNLADTFVDIFDDMGGSGEEYEIDVYQCDSKNYKGKTFLTCSVI